MTGTEIAILALKALDLLALGATLAPAQRTEAQAVAAKLRGMLDRDPTPEEWAELRAETEALAGWLDQRAAEARAHLTGE